MYNLYQFNKAVCLSQISTNVAIRGGNCNKDGTCVLILYSRNKAEEFV